MSTGNHTPTRSRALALTFVGLLALLVWAPLPFGSNRAWAWSLLAIGAGVLLAAWAWGTARSPGSLRVSWKWHLPATVMFTLAILWFLLQASGLTPAAWDHPIWAEAARVPGIGAGGAISLDPNASYEGVMRLLTYGAVFWLVLHLCRSRRRARIMLWTLVAAGTLYAAYGLAVQFSGTNTILWFEKWAYSDVVTSTFVNRNNYATYAGLTIVAAFALLTHEADEATAMGIANRAGWVYILDNVGPPVFIAMAALVVNGTALLLTASRGGIFATILGAAAFLASLIIYKRERVRRAVVFAGVIAIGGVMLLSFSGRELLVRLNQTGDDLSGRGVVWELTRDAIAERPWLGTGLGTFADVSVRVRDTGLSPRARPFARAHNGYLEMLLEGGIIGFALILGSLVWLGAWCAYGIVVRHNESLYPCAGIGALALVGSHAWVDFSLQIPAVGVTFAAILAVACAQAVRHRNS